MIMSEKWISEVVERTIFFLKEAKRNEKRIESEMGKERGQAGPKTSFAEKERGRNEIVCPEERLIPWQLSLFRSTTSMFFLYIKFHDIRVRLHKYKFLYANLHQTIKGKYGKKNSKAFS